MPIKIPESLPARATLESENIFTITEHRAVTQDIRPLRILLLNLMPCVFPILALKGSRWQGRDATPAAMRRHSLASGAWARWRETDRCFME